MNYRETIDYLYAQLPMFSKMGKAAYKADLHNTIALCDFLNNPQGQFKSVHIAGTNGKGSTSHMLAAILQQAGYKTGLYTSPHLKDFRERIRINGDMITQDFVVDFVERTKIVSESIQPSFFELTVAMAFDWFAQQKVDIAIIETGLGGRLDSTNVITPLLSIITNIGYDHMNILGDTLEKIAGEKAGIIKPGIPVVIGEKHPETIHVFTDKALQENSELLFAQDEYECILAVSSIQHLHLDIKNKKDSTAIQLSLDLNGTYQTKNILAVLSACKIITQNGFHITENDIREALQHVKQLTGLHGRWDVISTSPLIVMDVAHNEDGIKQVLQQLTLLGYSYPNVHFVFGMVKDKDINTVLSLLPTEAQYYFTNAHIPRALSATELQQAAATYHLQGKCFDDVNTAIAEAKKMISKKDIIVICGSVFLVAEVEY